MTMMPNYPELVWVWNATSQSFEGVKAPETFISKMLTGFSVFTTFRWPLPTQYKAQHWQRLHNNALAVGLSFPSQAMTDLTDALSSVLSTVVSEGRAPIVARLTVIPAQFPLEACVKQSPVEDNSQLLLTVRPCPTDAVPLRLKTVIYQKAFPHIKHGGLMEGWLLKQQAQTEGFDDALWVTPAGVVTETTIANIFFILSNGQLRTPHPTQAGCLPGIQRQALFLVAQEMGITVVEDRFTLAETLSDTEGCFVTNAVIGLKPVVQLDNVQLPWSSQAKTVYHALASKLASTFAMDGPETAQLLSL